METRGKFSLRKPNQTFELEGLFPECQDCIFSMCNDAKSAVKDQTWRSDWVYAKVSYSVWTIIVNQTPFQTDTDFLLCDAAV